MPSMRKACVAAVLAGGSLTLQGCGGGGSGAGPTPAPTPPPGPPTTTVTTTTVPDPFCKSGGPSPPSPPAGQAIGWNPTGAEVSPGKWCAVKTPAPEWRLGDMCGSSAELTAVNGTGISVQKERFLAASEAQNNRVKVLTYNLYWWNLFIQRKGADGMAGKNIAAFAKDEPFDLMGFQECEDVAWPIRDAGMTATHTTFVGDMATAIAYRTAAFDVISQGKAWVAEDRQDQHYGRRTAMWIRATHKPTGKIVFFMNHHGPTPVNTGGLCGPEATAYNLLKVIAENAKVGDKIILVGDFNAWSEYQGKFQEEIGYLACHLPHAFSNPVIGDVYGIDNFFSACTRVAETTVMPKGGSDHNALNTVFEI